MNRKNCLTLLTALSLAVLGAALCLADLGAAAAPLQPDAWVSPGALPEAWGGVVVQCPDEPDVFYRLGGLLSGGVETSQLSHFNVATNTWTTLANMPQARRIVAATCYQGKIYAAGGKNYTEIVNTLYIYDIASNAWSSGANTPTAVWGAALGAWEGKLYLVGGTYEHSPWAPTGRVDVYDIAAATWTVGGGTAMPTPASFPGAVQRGQYLYVAGGYSGDYDANVNQTQRYNMATDKWEVGPSFASQRAIVSMGMTATHLYALGGDANGGGGYDATNLVEALDLSAWPGGAWANLSDPLPFANIFPASACSEAKAGGEVWVIGGIDGSLNVYNTLYYRSSEPCFDLYAVDLLEEELSGSALPGDTASYTLHLLNAGAITDTYDIDASGLWTVTVPITLGPVLAGETVPLLVSVAVPPGAAPGEWDTAVITVTSQGDANAVDTAELTTYAEGWVDIGPLPEPRAGVVVQCPDEPDVFYRLGGILAGGVDTNKYDRYDVITDTWTTLANMPGVRRVVAATCYQGKIYAAGGFGNYIIYNTLYIYDIASNTWISGANTPTAVWGAALGAWEGKLYLVGGTYYEAPFTPTNRVDVYDIASDTWTVNGGQHMPTPASFPGRVQRGPHLYLVGGISGNYNANVNQTQRYDMSTNTWEVGPTFTSRRALVGLGMTSTHLYAMGGDANGGSAFDSTDLVEVLDLTAWPGGTWTFIIDSLPQINLSPASACTEAVAGGEIWVIGGALSTSTPYDTLYYRPVGPCFDFYFGDLPEENLTGVAGPGSTAHYLVDLTNTSLMADTFDIAASGAWTVTAPAAVGPVAAGVTVQIKVDVEVPPGAHFSDWDTALITVTSQGDPHAWDAATLNTSADGWAENVGSLPEEWAGVVVQCPDQPDVFYRLGGLLTGHVDTNQFSQFDVADPPWNWKDLANLPQNRRIVAAVCYQGKIYAAGGYSGSTIHNTLYIYDIASDVWSSGANLPTAVWGAALGAWGGKLYLVGGTYGYYPYIPTNRVDVYDIASNAWTQGGGTAMPKAASFFGAVQRGPYLFAVGGFSGYFDTKTQTQRYDMATDTWQAGPTFTNQRGLVALGMTGETLYALGGDLNGVDKTDITDMVEVLDLSAWPGGAWVELDPSLPDANGYPASACTEVLMGGEVWSIGGAGSTTASYDTLYYRPAQPCLHYGLALPVPSVGAGPVGQTMDYLLTITNTSMVTDYYQLEFTSDWVVDPLPASPVVVGPGQSAEVAFGVAIPADAWDGDSALTEVTATSLSNYMESAATTYTTVALGYAMNWHFDAPAHAALPGQVVTYTLTITNIGHLADSYVLSATGYAWAVTLPAAPIALDVGESAEVAVLVAPPLCACPGDADGVTIIATSQGDARVSEQALLTTSAGGYRIIVPMVLKN